MRSRWRVTSIALATLSGLIATSTGAVHAVPKAEAKPRLKHAAVRQVNRHPAPERATDAVVVKFRKGAAASRRTKAVKAAGASEGDAIGATGYVRVRTRRGKAATVAKKLAKDDAIAEVKPLLKRRIAALPNDPLYSHQPYLGSLHLNEAWAASRGYGVVIAVLDTGVTPTADLAGRVLSGIDIVNGDNNPADDNGHGTMVAGVAAAATNNGIGIAGIASEAKILPVKVLDDTGSGDDGAIAAGIHWATDHGAGVINLSLGGYGTSSMLDEALAYAASHNVVVVAAAGNDATSEPSYPAAAPSVVAVSATDASGRLVFFSNYGDYVDVAAPGWDMVGPDYAVAGQYDVESGTSFSSPVVAGVAALIRSLSPSMSQAAVAARLADSAADAGPDGRDPYFGAGVVNAWAAIGGPVIDPVVTAPAGDAHEPNDSPDTATTLAPNGSTTGTIGVEGDADWYTVTAPTAGVLGITIGAPAWTSSNGEAMDTVLDAYAANYAPIAEADVDGDLASGEQLQVPVSAGQLVRLRVRNWLPSVSNGPYTITSAVVASGSTPAMPAPPAITLRSALPDNNATGASGALPELRFLSPVSSPLLATTTLVRADTGAPVSAAISLLGLDVVRFQSAAPLAAAPYVIKVNGVPVSRFTVNRGAYAPFATAPAYAAQLYVDLLMRTVDPAISTWLGGLVQTYGLVPDTFIDLVLDTQEFLTKVAPVLRLYLSYFRSVPDYNSLRSWVAAYTNGTSLGTLSQTFWNPSGSQSSLGGLSNAAFVDKAYRQILGRAPTGGELAGWSTFLASGYSRTNAMVVLSELGENIARAKPTVEIAAVYAGMLRRAPNVAELFGWFGALGAGRTRASLVTDIYRSREYAARFGAV